MIRRWRHWSIRARVVAACVLPVCLTFVVTVGFLYRSHKHETQETMQAHASLMAHALSDSAQYGVIFGNWDYMNQIAYTLLDKTNNSLRKIAVFDKKRHLLLLRETTSAPHNSCAQMVMRWCNWLLGGRRDGMLQLEVPIYSVPVALPVSDPWTPYSQSIPSPMPPATIGYLSVSVSSTEFMQQQWWRMGVGLSVALGVLVASGWLGWRLARSVTRPLTRIVGSVREIQSGRYENAMAVDTGGEIGELQGAIIEMSAHLARFNRALEAKVQARTRELESAKDELTRLNEERRQLIQRIQSAVEDERRKIAFALHDHWNAQVIAIRLQATHALKLTEEPCGTDRRALLQNPLQAVIRTTEELYASGRDLVRQLYPEMIEVLGVVGAIEGMVETYDANHPSCRFHLRVEGDLPFSQGDLAITLYRLVQEALSNTVKHAGATLVRVSIAHDPVADRIRLIIADNGIGFDTGKAKSGIGLIGMRERVQAFDGTLAIASEPCSGTMVTALLPAPRDGR